MKARIITQKQLYAMVNADPPPGLTTTSTVKLKWDVAVLVPDCSSPKNRFERSVSEHVDAADKKSNFLLAISYLFDAICEDNYQEVLSGSAVGCKVAHDFKYDNRKFKVWELKSSNKDRIYFYAADQDPPNKKTIFLLMAYHKKDKTTPSEVKDPCEDEIKKIVKANGKIEFCGVKK